MAIDNTTKWYVDFGDIDGAVNIYQDDAYFQHIQPYGQLHGPYDTFGEAKRQAAELARHQIMEWKGTLKSIQMMKRPK